jgi:hypothetical protein
LRTQTEDRQSVEGAAAELVECEQNSNTNRCAAA